MSAACLRRVKPAPPPSLDRRNLRFGRHVLDLDARRLFALDGSEVTITAMEFDLLEAFALNPNRVLSRDRLLELAHKGGNDPFDRSIDTRVARLRQKIEPHPEKPQTIKTVRGVGYVFVAAAEPGVGRPICDVGLAPRERAPPGEGRACQRAASGRSRFATPGASSPPRCRCSC